MIQTIVELTLAAVISVAIIAPSSVVIVWLCICLARTLKRIV